MLVVLCPAILSSDTASDPGRRDLLRARRRLFGSECCSSNSNAPDQKGLIGIQSHHSMGKMAKKTREKTEEAGSASVSPCSSVLGYELVTSQPSRPITVVWPEYRTWFIGPCSSPYTRWWWCKQSLNRNKYFLCSDSRDWCISQRRKSRHRNMSTVPLDKACERFRHRIETVIASDGAQWPILPFQRDTAWILAMPPRVSLV